MISEIINFIDNHKAKWSFMGDYFFINKIENQKIPLKDLENFNGIQFKYDNENNLLIQEVV